MTEIILELERKARELNREIFILQEELIGAIVDITISTILFRESNKFEELDVLEIELELISQRIGETEAELTKARELLNLYLSKLENL